MDQSPPREPPFLPPPPPPPVPPLPTPQQTPEDTQVPWRAREGILILILSLLSGFFFSALAASAIEDRDTLQLVVTIIIEANLGMWVVLWVRLRHRVGPRALGWNFKLEDVGSGFLAALLGLGASAAASNLVISLYRAVSNNKVEQPEQLPTSLTGSRVALAVIAVVIVAPIAEELFFRGFLYQALRKWRGVPQATVLSGFLFALAHGHPLLILGIFPLGIILAFLFQRRNSLAATIAAHAFFNGISLIILLTF
jgi:uncharacterized protein